MLFLLAWFWEEFDEIGWRRPSPVNKEPKFPVQPWKAERDFQVTETWVSNDILDLSFTEKNVILVFILWEISVAYLQICVF